MKHLPRKISEDFKRKVVLEVMSGELSGEAARRVYDIRGKSAVTNWVRLYGAEFWWVENPAIGLPAMSEENEKLTIEQLKAKVKELRARLELEKHKSGLLDTLIDVAQERFHIEIRKKPGARQLPNTKNNTKE